MHIPDVNLVRNLGLHIKGLQRKANLHRHFLRAEIMFFLELLPSSVSPVVIIYISNLYQDAA